MVKGVGVEPSFSTAIKCLLRVNFLMLPVLATAVLLRIRFLF